MKRGDGHYAQSWPEQAEQTTGTTYGMRVPSWPRLVQQAEIARTQLTEHEIRSITIDVPDRQQFGTVESPFPIDRFDLRNLFCFQYLPEIIDIKQQAIASIALMSEMHRGDGDRLFNGLKGWKGVLVETDANGRPREDPEAAYWRQVQELQEQIRAEFAHSLYHHAMWRESGRHVYVLDRTTYHLLAETPLPDLPASILSAPHHSFYLALPPEAFEFGVWNTRTQEIDRQPIEGVIVSIDNIDADSPYQREIAFMAVGQGADASDRNIAFISFALGPDARLSDVQMGGGNGKRAPLIGTHDRELWRTGENGGHELGVVIPRVILSLLLYLASEHPDIEPVPPAPRRTFADIRSPKQRAAALANQAAKLKGATRLPILYVGGHLHEEITAERERVEQAIAADGGRTWKLDHPVWVSGHWRQQPYGAGRTLRRIIWIRPYQKGPDMAAAMTVHAAKVQRAQHAGK